MAVLKLQVDKPVPGCLKFAKGKFGESKFPGGDYYMYTLGSGDVMFLEEKICDTPDELFASKHIGKGDPFVITLRKTPSGGKFYEVQKLSEASEIEPEPLDPRRYPDQSGSFERKLKDSLTSESKLERDLAASIAQGQQRKAAASLPNIPAPPAVAVASTTLPPRSNIAIVPSPERPRPGSLIASALVAAVDAVVIAQEYATAKGLGFAFGAEDVRAIAATLYIQHSKDNPQYAQRAGGRQ